MDESDFPQLPYVEQLKSALKMLMNHADNGIIHGGSIPELLMHQFKIVPHRARIISEDLKALGFRRTERDGKRHTHYIVPPPSGDITAEDMAKVDALREQKRNAKLARKTAANSQAEAQDVGTVNSDDSSDLEALLKAIQLLEEGAERTREHVETLRADLKTQSERADGAEAKVKELNAANAELNRELDELRRSCSVSDPRVRAIREKYQV